MSGPENAQVPGHAWFDIIKRETGEDFAAAFTEHAALDASIMPSPVEGAISMRRFFDTTRQMFDSITFTRETQGDGATFLDWKAVYGGEPMSGITILETDEHGLIRRVRTFYGPWHQAKRFAEDVATRLPGE